MLLFYCTPPADFDAIRRRGIHPSGEGDVLLWTSLDAAQTACDGAILVVDAALLERDDERTPPEEAGSQVRVGAVPPRAVGNIDPFFPPRSVVAGGGYVVRRGEREPDVLLIFRRGVWDLPKGKLDERETIVADKTASLMLTLSRVEFEKEEEPLLPRPPGPPGPDTGGARDD